MTKHHHNLALKNAIIAHCINLSFMLIIGRKFKNMGIWKKKILTNKFLSPKLPQIFEFSAKYEQKIKNFFGHSWWKNLNPSLLKAWNDIDSDLVCACSLNAHKRFEAVVEAKDGYIEKK